MEYTVHEGTKVTCKVSKNHINPPMWTDEVAGIHFVASNAGYDRKVYYDMGYKVRAVLRSGPAYEAGIRNGDEILSFGGKGSLTPKSLTKLIRECAVNQTITIRYRTNGNVRVRNVRIGSVRRKGKTLPSLGVITNKTKANAYNAKVGRRLKKAAMSSSAKPTLAHRKASWPGDKSTTPEVIDELKAAKPAAEENHFKRKAREEMGAVLQLVEDLEGADALKEAKALRRRLRAENLKSMDRATEIVNDTLNAMNDRKNAEQAAEDAHLNGLLEKKSWRLSRLGKKLFKTTAAVLSVAGVAAAITFAVQSYPFF